MVNKNVTNDYTDSVKIYYKELKKYTPIKSIEEERQLLSEAKSGNINSRNKLINAHLKYVFDVAKGYKGKGVSMGDLISAGNDGVILAIDKFNMEKQTKFITYAVFWIRERIITAIEDNAKLTYNERHIEDIIHPRANCSWKDVEEKYSEDDESVSKIDTLFQDKNSRKYDKRLNKIDALINSLSPKEKYVICSCYGIGCQSMNLKTLSKTLNISAERIRQIKISGIHKMRAYALLSKDTEAFF